MGEKIAWPSLGDLVCSSCCTVSHLPPSKNKFSNAPREWRGWGWGRFELLWSGQRQNYVLYFDLNSSDNFRLQSLYYVNDVSRQPICQQPRNSSFVLIRTRQHCVAKLWHTSLRTNTQKLQNDSLNRGSIIVWRFCGLSQFWVPICCFIHIILAVYG